MVAVLALQLFYSRGHSLIFYIPLQDLAVGFVLELMFVFELMLLIVLVLSLACSMGSLFYYVNNRSMQYSDEPQKHF